MMYIVFDGLWKWLYLLLCDCSIVMLLVLIVCGQIVEMLLYVCFVLDYGVKFVEILEMIVYLVFYVGWVNVSVVLIVVKYVYDECGIGFDQFVLVDVMLLLLNEVVEVQCVWMVVENFGVVVLGVVEYMIDVLFCDLWFCLGFVLCDCSLVMVSVFVVNGQVVQILYYLNCVMDNGFMQVEVFEVLM